MLGACFALHSRIIKSVCYSICVLNMFLAAPRLPHIHESEIRAPAKRSATRRYSHISRRCHMPHWMPHDMRARVRECRIIYVCGGVFVCFVFRVYVIDAYFPLRATCLFPSLPHLCTPRLTYPRTMHDTKSSSPRSSLLVVVVVDRQWLSVAPSERSPTTTPFPTRV